MGTLAITRAPSARLGEGELTHLARTPVDVELAREQHRAYCAALERCGCRVRVLPPLEDHPDAVFVEDTAVVLERVAVLARPGAASRRGEVASVGEALAPWRALVELEEPATLDGGDVLRVGDVLWVGWGGRTNHAGLKALAHAVLEHGLRVQAARTRGCLHLKSAATCLGGEVCLVQPAWLEPGALRGLERVEVDPVEPDAANALAVNGRVLLAASAPRTADRVAAAGFDVELVDISELQRMEGALTCQSLLLEVADGAPDPGAPRALPSEPGSA